MHACMIQTFHLANPTRHCTVLIRHYFCFLFPSNLHLTSHCIVHNNMARGHKRSCTSVDSDDADHPRGYSPHGSKLGARSCKSCYERKVRCDRSLPCTNCSRSGRICAYPTPKNEGRKTATLQNVYDRLERLENLISCLVDKRQVPATLPPGDCDPVVGHDGEPPFQSQDQSVATINTLGPVNRYSLESGPFKSTWDLLLKDKEGPKFPNSGTTLQDVSGDFRKLQLMPTHLSFLLRTIVNGLTKQFETLVRISELKSHRPLPRKPYTCD